MKRKDLAAAGRRRSYGLVPANCLARHSRFAAFHALASPMGHDDYLMATVTYLRLNTRARILLPADEAAMVFVARNQRELATEWQPMPVPSLAALQTVMTSRDFAIHMANYSLPQPQTEFAENPADALAAASRVGYPLLLKPVRSPGNGLGIRRYDHKAQLRTDLTLARCAVPCWCSPFCQVRTRIAASSA